MRHAILSAALLLATHGAFATTIWHSPTDSDDYAGLLPVGQHALACISANDASGAACAQGLAGFAVSLSQSGDRFTWTLANNGAQATATRVYLELTDDARFVALDAIGAIFSKSSKVKDLPGGNAVDFDAEWYFEAKNPGPKNGLNPGDSLSLTFRFPHDDDWSSSDLGRLGFHAQAFDGDFSESFVTTGALTPVPLPGANVLFGAGLFGLGLLAIRRQRSAS